MRLSASSVVSTEISKPEDLRARPSRKSPFFSGERRTTTVRASFDLPLGSNGRTDV